MATQKNDSAGSLLEGIRNSPATERLMEAGRGVLGRQVEGLGDKLGGLTSRIGDIAESGHLPVAGKVAKNMAEGKGTGKSMLGAVTSGITDKAKDLVGKGQSGGGGKSGKSPKAMNIEESIDVGVPVSIAYNQWTQFTEFAQFTKGVESVEQKDDTELVWRAKVFKSHRTWNAKIVEQVPDKRIVWTSDGPKGSTRGVVTFHPLGEELTRVLLAMEYYPQGAVERVGNIWRAAGRRARLDLKNYRRFVMLEHDATGEWRGEIHDGEVKRQPGEGRQPRKATKSAGRNGRESSRSGSDGGGSRDGGRRPRKATASEGRSGARKATARASDSPRKATARGGSGPRKATAREGGSSANASNSARSEGAGSDRDASGNGRSSEGGPSARKATSEGRPSPRKAAPRKAAARKAQPARKAAAKKAQPPARKAAAKKAQPARKAAPAAKRTAARKQAPAKRTAKATSQARGRSGR